MSRFMVGVSTYIALCLIVTGAIVIRGDGPHPRILALYPSNGDRYWPGGTAQISFSQTMDQSTVVRSLQVTPGSQGQGAWYGNTLNLQPVGDWQPNVTYHVQLIGKVTDDQGRRLPTPFRFWFRVHHVERITFCRIHGIRNVCEPLRNSTRLLTHSHTPVQQFALSSDGAYLAYTHSDVSILPHLFVQMSDGTGMKQLTHGRNFEDSSPQWGQGDSNSITYYRRPVHWLHGGPILGTRQLWNINIDGTHNARLA
ncbi:MAG: hypothetical protein NVSMB52_09710 [Chloroflexota bacterium]